ncbi:hypothetical protein QUF64_09755 [Anaerolineales bacterium HSG6]|nr:hypothetical protein [Anaerolineales bacterium HSG6]MDM8531418.1 hypothetical protein [Anaerolineales bacterium HSG25]
MTTLTITSTEQFVSLFNEQLLIALEGIAKQTGKSEIELIREAVEQFVKQFDRTRKLALLRQARGMWEDRPDIPSVRELRTEFDRPRGQQ